MILDAPNNILYIYEQFICCYIYFTITFGPPLHLHIAAHVRQIDNVGLEYSRKLRIICILYCT